MYCHSFTLTNSYPSIAQVGPMFNSLMTSNKSAYVSKFRSGMTNAEPERIRARIAQLPSLNIRIKLIR